MSVSGIENPVCLLPGDCRHYFAPAAVKTLADAPGGAANYSSGNNVRTVTSRTSGFRGRMACDC